MVHPAVVADRLEREIRVAREQFASSGLRLEREGLRIRMWFPGVAAEAVVLLDGARYNADPLSLTVADRNGEPLPSDRWPSGLFHSQHPALQRPFACLRGLLEYHTHPSHTDDPWDRYRNSIRLVDLVGHIMAKVPKP